MVFTVVAKSISVLRLAFDVRIFRYVDIGLRNCGTIVARELGLRVAAAGVVRCGSVDYSGYLLSFSEIQVGFLKAFKCLNVCSRRQGADSMLQSEVISSVRACSAMETVREAKKVNVKAVER